MRTDSLRVIFGPRFHASLEYHLGRWLIAVLFAAGAVQKAVNPAAGQALLADAHLPVWLVWPALVFNGTATALLIANAHIKTVSRSLALYCIVTSAFHLIPSDPWQMSIFVKNWAIAGGCLILSAYAAREEKSPE